MQLFSADAIYAMYRESILSFVLPINPMHNLYVMTLGSKVGLIHRE